MIEKSPLGVSIDSGSTHFSVRAPRADAVWLCLFDGDRETCLAMQRDADDWRLALPGDRSGTRYGFRADGKWDPDGGMWFDPAKLLLDPYAVVIDAPFRQVSAFRQFGVDTASVMPKAIVFAPLPDIPKSPPHFAAGGLVYEINVRSFTMLHPDLPDHLRGTVAALAHPSIIAHLQRIGVAAIELMPVTAWIDERHLPPLGLSNAWGYNPVAMMPLDPRLAPGGYAELRETVSILHDAGIGVILDLVLNHTGESDTQGGILSLRGLDNDAYACAPNGSLINDSGCGNTLDFAKPSVRSLMLQTLRHFVWQCGVDGFRFDLAPILARAPGFDPAAPFFAEIAADPWLNDRILIAEPWDIGPGGYQLGRFPENWLEWNDRYRDDVRRFWRGDGAIGALATRLAGSSDIFGETCRSVNFLAAHDGFTLADTVAYQHRHNEANGEGNRDGHDENFSWNHGAEGPCDDADVNAARGRDLRALLATLFASTGTIMLTAGDEFGRSQCGNNNAYAQDNHMSWLDWANRDQDLEAYVSGLAAQRKASMWRPDCFDQAGAWWTLDGRPMGVADWEAPDAAGFVYQCATHRIVVDRAGRTVVITPT